MHFFNRRNILYSIVTIVILTLVSLSFISVITNDTRKDTEIQMRELSNQTISVISQKLHSDSVSLHSIAETVGGSTMQLNTEALRSYLDRKRGIYGFGDIVVIDLDGKPLSAIGTRLPNMKEQEFFKLALQGRVVLHNGLSLDNKDEHLVRIAQPLRRNGKTIAVLYGVYMPNQLRSLLSEKLFDNSASTKLVTSTGDVVSAQKKHLQFYTIDSFFDNEHTNISAQEHEHY